nr:fad-dependent monooxygenase yanf [Quercus suber]
MTSSHRWPNILLIAATGICIVAVLIPLLLRQNTTVLEITPSPVFSSTEQSSTCVALANSLPGSVYTTHDAPYQKSVSSYWSLTACEKRPSCVVLPTTAQEVATTVGLLKAAFNSPPNSTEPFTFAVRSGGHSPEAGFASIDGGIVIDLSLLNKITLSSDRRSASIGVGARWADVSTKLDGVGLAIVGGRNADVGVGGLVLGGEYLSLSPTVSEVLRS